MSVLRAPDERGSRGFEKTECQLWCVRSAMSLRKLVVLPGDCLSRELFPLLSVPWEHSHSPDVLLKSVSAVLTTSCRAHRFREHFLIVEMSWRLLGRSSLGCFQESM